MKLINYPAMASPDSMRFIARYISEKLRPGSNVIDPFCGTGRLLFGPRAEGHSVTGVDCSPVAVLTARVGHQGNNLKRIAKDYLSILNNFHGLNKVFCATEEELFWFPQSAYSDLRKLLLAIDLESSTSNVRRFFWLVLVQVARVTSYIRESEYKTHRIKPGERESFNPDVLDIFMKTYSDLYLRISKLPSVKVGRYRFLQGDVSTVGGLSPKFDALITSPPYGDSISTVGYGQFARIPLLILSRSKPFNEEFVVAPGKGSLDTFCLGGGNCRTDDKPLLPPQVSYIDRGPMRKFCEDYFYRLKLISDQMKDDSYCGFVLADRTYKSRRFPLIGSTVSFMQELGFEMIAKEDRYLSWKRLPRSMRLSSKLDFSSHQGMNYESVVIMKRSK